MKKETLLEVVSELIGHTEPHGDIDIDKIRYENQEKIIALVENGLKDLIKNSECRNCKVYSVSQIGGKAYEALERMHQIIENSLSEDNS